MVLEQQEQEQEYSLCLNMIVKNESHIIKDTLTKLLQKIKFDYWVISDTGSTDETCEAIIDYFKEAGIPGELYQDDWVDFSHNRNKALEYAFGKSNYLLVFDADDEICGDFVLPELTKDSYSLQFGSYTRPQIVNNYKRWKYVGVLHEYICSNDSRINDASTEIIKGPYHVVSGRTGNRNLDSNKYLKDATILEKAYHDAFNAKDDIYIRYGFYCANSYYDCGKYESAISWYKKTLENGGWSQEKYVSCLKLYNCYNNLDKKEAGFFYLVKSAEYDRERAECCYELIKYYSGSGLYSVAYGYYGVLRDFYRDTYLNNDLNNKLFVNVSISEIHLPCYVIIVCDKMRDYETGIQMYRIIFTKKCKIFDTWIVGNMLYNLQFFTAHVKEEDKMAFYSLFQEYVDFLFANNYPISDSKHQFMNTYKKYGIVVPSRRFESTANGNDCSSSKKILIYTGFMEYLWNDTYVSNNAIGGAEKAVVYLARNLPKEYEIIISGDVADEVVGNVKYVNRFALQALLDVEKFHTIIVSRYVSFFLLFPRFHCHQLYLSSHDTGFLNNFNDITVNCLIEENNKYINGVICLTTWHKLNVVQSHPCLKDKISIINNGIPVPESAFSHNKIKNKFVWTSCSSRGLDLLLKLWDKILEVMPDATLDISSYDAFPNPNRNKDEEIEKLITQYSDSVTHHGKLNTLQLHDLISKAEYWLYTCTFYETSCITALEMLMHEVVCLYYPLAGLNETIGKYGIQVIPGTELQSIVNLSEERKAEMRINGKKYAMSCSWENRAKEWVSVLGLNNRDKCKQECKIKDLREIINEEQLQHLNKTTKKEYDFGIFKPLEKEISPRRKKVIDFLTSHNFSINVIEECNYNDRCFEFAKCKFVLNVNENLNENASTIFKDIQCDGLLEAGFTILSETSSDLCPEFIQKYPNLRLIKYEDFFDIGIMVDCYNNPLMSKEHNKYVLDILNNCYNKIDIPLVHISFIEKLSLEFNPNRMVIYDIGSSVLHWTQHAKVFWKNSTVYLFDAMTEMKLFYDEYNKIKNTTFEYNVGVLCDEDYKRISFYQNDELSGGNSYYKEIGHPESHNIFTENHIKHKLGMKLETVVKNKKIPLPDLIKIDVQGAELDILKGSMNIINNAKFLIVELQHVEYNKGAPLCNKTCDFLIENGWEVYAEKFSNNGPDADWCFVNKNHKNR
jgi:FkbM family methyltransferase